MIAQNHIVRSVLMVLAFWYVGLFALAGFHGVPPWRVFTALPISALISGLGMIVGFVAVLLLRAGKRGHAGKSVRAGSQQWGARFSMGSPPPLGTLARGAVPTQVLAQQPWWAALERTAPAHAAAVRAVAAVMLAVPRLPASPYPGGHGGLSLFEHSLAVAKQTLIHARGWEYRGQKDKRGTVRVPLADPDRPHRFGGADAPLLVLAGLAHDIGKIACYLVDAGQPTQRTDGPVLRVTEVKRLHDIEGARLLRRLPEIMALPMADRTALLTAVCYYHHPFGLPQAAWLTDRIRSLTELLAQADMAVGQAEGHTLIPADPDEDIEDGGITPVVREAVLMAGTQLDAASLDAIVQEQAREAEDLMRAVQRRGAPPAPMPGDDSSVPMELRLFMTAIRRQGAINGRDRACRIAWKREGLVYVLDKPMRTLVLNQGGADPLWAAEAMAEANGNAAPFTASLATQLHARGALVTTFDGQEFSPARALFKMKTANGSIPVLIVRADAIPGATGIPDADQPVQIVGPLWGAHSARNKAKPATTDVHGVDYDTFSASISAPINTPAIAAIAPVDAASATAFPDLDEDDLPFPLPLARVELASAPPSAAALASDDDASTLLWEQIISDEFRQQYGDAIQYRQKGGDDFALIVVASPAGESITRAVAALRDAGADVSAVTISTLGDTGQAAYVFQLGSADAQAI